MTISIGALKLDNGVILAPMSGVSDLPFRRLVKRWGAGLVVSEMIASQAMIRANRKTLKMTTNCAEEQPMAVQLAGCEPEFMAEAAKLNEDRGAAIIDINMGCPVKKVVNKQAGSALMRDLDHARRIIDATVAAVNVPVTLKMRKGWDEDNLNAPELARIAQESGIAMITVHGRTREQMYNGTADWKFIRRVVESVSIPVVANGDIRDFDDVDGCLAESGAAGVMIGRGAMGRPWFPGQIVDYLESGRREADPSRETRGRVVLEHLDAMLSHFGTDTGIRMARKHLAWYSKRDHGGVQFRSKINKIWNISDLLNEVENFFFKDASGAVLTRGSVLATVT